MGKARRASDAAKIGKRISVKINSSLKNETITGRLLAVESTDGSLVLSDAERERRTQGGSYVLRDMMGDLFRRNVAPSQLKMVSADQNRINDHEDQYEVERIINHKIPVFF